MLITRAALASLCAVMVAAHSIGAQHDAPSVSLSPDEQEHDQRRSTSGASAIHHQHQHQHAAAVTVSRPSPACSEALRGACDAQRKQGDILCIECAGAHKGSLRSAGCAQADIGAFCANQTCGTQLSQACAASQGDCAACTACATRLIANNTSAACNVSDVAAFCEGACAGERQCEASMLRLCEPGTYAATQRTRCCIMAWQWSGLITACSWSRHHS